MPESVEVAVIGAGQAGLALSYELTHAGIEHLVLERARVGESWRQRWDSFCLVTPNWSMRLPGGHYDGDDPDGFMPRDEIVDHFVRYAQRFGAPVRAGVEVLALQGNGSGGFRLRTTSGDIRAGQVVIAAGAFQKPHRPPHAGRFPAGLHVIDAAEYTNPHALPPGKVLIVGSGQTGCQLAEELLEAGRDVFLSCGRVPWCPRRIGDADFVEWFIRTSFLESTPRGPSESTRPPRRQRPIDRTCRRTRPALPDVAGDGRNASRSPRRYRGRPRPLRAGPRRIRRVR